MPRNHWVEGGENGLFQAFFNVVSKLKIKTSMSTTAERLIRDPATDRIVAVQAVKSKKTIYIKANKAVVLASGGFSRNIEMLTAYAPSGNNYKGAKGSPGVVGDGIKMVQEVGADLRAIHETLESMGILGALNAYFTPFMEYTLIVNNKGVRFISEGAWTESIFEETFKQPDGEVFLIFDASLRACSELDTTLGRVVPTKYLVEANSLEELAAKFDIPSETFLKTVADYNGYCESGVDPMGKTKGELFALTKAPFYGIKSNPLPVMTTSGLLTDADGRVLNYFKEHIPCLYAAGEVTGGKLIGYPGCVTAVTDATIFGLIAGENAAAGKAWK